eukprot:2957952-Pyramimonas_sp.AAC.1
MLLGCLRLLLLASSGLYERFPRPPTTSGGWPLRRPPPRCLGRMIRFGPPGTSGGWPPKSPCGPQGGHPTPEAA